MRSGHAAVLSKSPAETGRREHRGICVMSFRLWARPLAVGLAATAAYLCLAAAAALLLTRPAAAEKRIALVIGNAAYVHTAKLPNPGNDANDMATALKELGFEVILGLD